jgi:tetratricopeptide (TPR) repeat protein
VKWVRRRPARALLLAGGSLFAMAVLGNLLWTSWQRTILARAAREDLVESRNHLNASRMSEARAAIERAKGRLGQTGPEELRREVEAIDRDLDLVAALGELRTRRSVVVQYELNDQVVDQGYQEAFQQAGLGALGEDPAPVAARIAASPVHDSLVAALDDWALCAEEPERRPWVLEVARRADPDPNWRDQVRTFAPGDDGERLKVLAASTSISSQPVPVLLLLATRLRSVGVDPSPFLQRVQNDHPDDFWVQFELATALDEKGDPGAIGCYQAALAIRPGTLAVLTNLGTALAVQRRFEEAFDAYERALRVDPESVMVHMNYAAALMMAERYDESIEHAQAAIHRDPTLTVAHAALGKALWRQGRYSEAREAAQIAIDLNPQDPHIRSDAAWVVLDSERRMALQDRLPAVLDGTDQPGDGAEAAQFATLCKERQLYCAAARLFADAFVASPALADDILSGNRMNAAASAARLGCGKDGLNGSLDDVERSSWRARARAWIKEDIDLWTRTLESCDLAMRIELRRRVVLLREDPCLVGLREQGELMKLPPEERKECSALWRDLDALQYRIDQRN